MSPGSWRHGAIISNVHGRIESYVRRRKFGRLFGAETGFLIERNPDTVRAPDLAFIHKDHLPSTDPDDAFWPGAPDLAVEVISPGDSRSEVAETIEAWLAAGCLMVWVIDAKLRTVAVHRPAGNRQTLTVADEIDGGEVLPGFRMPVAAIFEL
jgi:Uma2 family endonuclease